MRIVSFGGGLNSTALVIEAWRRGMHVDAILFADTGAELPETYLHVAQFSEWCKSHGLPAIEVVSVTGESLEANCLRRNALPSVSYGFKTCSQRWKVEPQEKYLNNWLPARQAWARGELIEKLIGFDADESHRVRPYQDNKYVSRYPLVEWDMGRAECSVVAASEGFIVPKSSCFFCANRSASEYRSMRETHPEYLERAILLEENADLTSIKGLKRDYSLKQLLSNGELFCFDQEECASCYDGDGTDLDALEIQQVSMTATEASGQRNPCHAGTPSPYQDKECASWGRDKGQQ